MRRTREAYRSDAAERGDRGGDFGALRRVIDYAIIEALERGRPTTAHILDVARQSLNGAEVRGEAFAEARSLAARPIASSGGVAKLTNRPH